MDVWLGDVCYPGELMFQCVALRVLKETIKLLPTTEIVGLFAQGAQDFPEQISPQQEEGDGLGKISPIDILFGS